MHIKGRLIIIDNQKKRAECLNTICEFIYYNAEKQTYSDWKNIKINKEDIFILGFDGNKALFLSTLTEINEQYPDNPIITVDNPAANKEFAKFHISANLVFPFNYAQMIDALKRCEVKLQSMKDQPENASNYKAPLFRSMVGMSESICKIRELINQVADTEASVMILGESGTGKEVVARNIHALSARHEKPFIPINCGAIPAELLESELFGHEKGAFTGAITARQGRFELANSGTLFLDEIGDMPLPMQVKLLRVLQEKCFERVGSNKSIKTNVRIIAATHRNLEKAIKEGKFREDLYYRLNVFPIHMPPLRERKKDIPLLINELISRLEGTGLSSIHIMPKALEALSYYEWPGNVRELANLIERLAILHPQGIVDKKDLPARFRGEEEVVENERDVIIDIIRQQQDNDKKGIDLKEYLANTEMALISQALDESDWVVAHAANYLNMGRTTLVEKMRRYGLSRADKNK
jgi:sigma-54 specific flagellar transcriptional regulator A